MSDDIPIDSEPPAYDEPSTDSKAGLTPMDTKTVPNDTSPDGTAGSPPPPTIQVEPPPVSNGVTNGTFPNDNPPPVIGSHSQQDDAQPRLGDDLSPKSDARSVVDSEQPESLLPESPSQRLEEALAFRRKAAKLQKLIVVTEAERKLALEDNKRAVALLKVQERETLEKEEKELNRKAERRFFTGMMLSTSVFVVS
jgi:hypothetical protein